MNHFCGEEKRSFVHLAACLQFGAEWVLIGNPICLLFLLLYMLIFVKHPWIVLPKALSVINQGHFDNGPHFPHLSSINTSFSSSLLYLLHRLRPPVTTQKHHGLRKQQKENKNKKLMIPLKILLFSILFFILRF